MQYCSSGGTQCYTVPTPLSNKKRIIKTKVTLFLENYHVMNGVFSTCNMVPLVQYTEFHSVPSINPDCWHECCHQFPDRKHWHGEVTWHVCGPGTPTCQHGVTCRWHYYTNMSTWHVPGCYTMSTWHDMSVALLHQYVNMTGHATGPITPTCQHDMACLWLFWPTC